jgi:N-dimethylarginine dimethylaminohydrolase
LGTGAAAVGCRCCRCRRLGLVELEDAGAEVLSGTAQVPEDPDAIYAYDSVLIAHDGAILLCPGKLGRRREPKACASDLRAAGVSILGTLRAPACAEGGDMFWLDSRTLLAGRAYRTNDEGIEQLRRLMPDVDVVAFDLPYRHGPDQCLHLMSLLSPIDRDLVVGYVPLMPVRLVELLAFRHVELVSVPHDQFETMGGTQRARAGTPVEPSRSMATSRPAAGWRRPASR